MRLKNNTRWILVTFIEIKMNNDNMFKVQRFMFQILIKILNSSLAFRNVHRSRIWFGHCHKKEHVYKHVYFTLHPQSKNRKRCKINRRHKNLKLAEKISGESYKKKSSFFRKLSLYVLKHSFL